MLVSEKKKKERIELLLSNIRVYKKHENSALDFINKRGGNPLACMRSNGSLYEFKASECLLFYKDIETFKKYMYIYAKLSILGYDGRGFLRGSKLGFWGILMSNNREILDFIIRNIDIIAYEEKKDEYMKTKTYRFLSRTILLAIKGEWEDVIRRANIYLKNPSKDSYNKYTYLEFEFLKALAEKDVEKMKETLNQMLDKKVAKKMLYDMDVAFDFYLHMFVIMYAKIAMYHGFDLGIDNEIAP
ncbi:Imm49 family immunity protein, partial [Fusobacterium russii]|uniref:Imm49 family immunity protein n=1 Tax=Fusobacterium russii TaxID=854 RepID=UPI0003B67255